MLNRLKRCKEVVFAVILMVLFLSPICAMAATAKLSTSKIKSILSQYPLESNSVFTNVLRSIGWAVVTGLHWLVDGLETSIYSINDAIGGFFTSPAVTQLEQKVFPLALALVVLVILYIGLLSMFKPPNFSNIVGNFTIGIIVFISLPYLLSTAYTFTTQAITYINGDSKSLQLMSDKILVDNITDTTRYDAEGFNSTTLKYKSYFASGADPSKIASIDINELVDPSKMKYPDVWKNRLVTDQNGTASLQELNSGQYGFVNISVFSQYYYRWNVDWFTVLTTLIVTAAALLLSGIKIARLVYELAINQLMAQVMALLDIVTAQRLKKCIQLLISTLGTLFAVFLMLQMYILGTSYVSAQPNLNIFVRIILMLALAFAVVDGPNLFEQIFGIDAGIRSGMRTLYGLKAAGSLVGGGVALMGGKGALDALRSKGIMGAARSVLSGAGSVVGGAGGVAAGIAKSAADNRKRVSAVQNGFSSAAGSVAGNAAGAVGGAVAGAVANGVSGQPSAPSSSTAPSHSGQAAENTGIHGSVKAPENTQGAVTGNAAGAPNVEPNMPPVQPSYENASYPGSTAQNGPDTASSENTESQNSTGDGQQTAKKNESRPEPVSSLGDYVRSKVTNGFRQLKPVARTRHVYGLTRGGMQKHGDKLVERETRAQSLLQDNTDLNCTGQNVSEPLHTITAGAGHFCLMTGFLEKYYGQGVGQQLDAPLDTVVSKDRFGLINIKIERAVPGIACGRWPQIQELLNQYCGYTLEPDEILIFDINGEDYIITDIGLRMLTPRELYDAQGFPSDYIIDRDYRGRKYPKSEQVARCGNAVPPPFAYALVKNNLPELCYRTCSSMAELNSTVAI